MKNGLILLAVSVATLFIASTPAFAQKQGDVVVTGGGGVRVDSDSTDIQLALGVGYFVIDGLEVSAEGSSIFGDPFVLQTTLGTRYIFYQLKTVKPYAGGFYRHWFIDGFDDQDTIGGRAGIVVNPGSSKVQVSAGVVYEQIISACDEDCGELYPELSISFRI